LFVFFEQHHICVSEAYVMIKVESLNLDPLTLSWLDRNTNISRTDLGISLTAEEIQTAGTIKAGARRYEFERSRLLLRSQTGAKTSFLPDSENIPGWPPNLCGSITHKNGHVAISTASKSYFHSIGIDTENAVKDISHLQEKICTTTELNLIQSLSKEENVELGSAVALIFSAKEALFKCHFPLGKLMFWFHDAEVEHIDFTTGDIAIKVLLDTSAMTKKGFVTKGRFLLHNASDGLYWITAFYISASSF